MSFLLTHFLFMNCHIVFLGVDNTGSYLEYFPFYMPGVVLTLFVITKMNNKNIDWISENTLHLLSVEKKVLKIVKK